MGSAKWTVVWTSRSADLRFGRDRVRDRVREIIEYPVDSVSSRGRIAAVTPKFPCVIREDGPTHPHPPASARIRPKPYHPLKP
jgi:hypothetical protein